MIVWLFLSILLILVLSAIYALYRWPLKMLAISFVTTIVVYTILHSFMERSAIGMLPDSLQVTEMIYLKWHGGGPFPGDEETDFIIYRLPDATAEGISTEGIEFLSRSLPYKSDQLSFGKTMSFSEWKPTPIIHDDALTARHHEENFGKQQYVCPSDFCIDVDPRKYQEFKATLEMPGSYYTGDRNSLIVVSPTRRRVYLLFDG